MTVRIAFPFFRHAYHVYHGATIAFEMSLLDANADVHIYSSYHETTEILHELAVLYPGHKCTIHELPPLPVFRYFNIKNRTYPKTQSIIDKHADLFRNMDVIVDTCDSLLRLITVHNITSPKYISIFHGAGDRKRFLPERFRNFDYFLIGGRKRFNQLNEIGLLTESNWALGGYPKFDIVAKTVRNIDDFFPEKRPVILYNPHFERNVSSWYRWGRKILKYFSQSKRYNLIFAPHVELKGRKNRFLSLKKYDHLPNICVDLGSRNDIDMTYTRLSDIYLGDASSQTVEFLYEPRPCIFLNAHGISWKENPYYLHWQLGTIVNDLSQLESAIDNAFTDHLKYIDKQISYFKDSVDLTDVPSGKRSADAILSFIKRDGIGNLNSGENKYSTTLHYDQR